MSIRRPITRFARRLLWPLAYLLALVLPVLLVIAARPLYTAALTLRQSPAPALDQPLPPPPAHDPAKRTALIVAGNTATESSDLLAPYEVLATSGAFNVYVVAPERRLTPLLSVPHCCGTVDLVPHYSFAEYDRAIGVTPDLVVVPYIPRAAWGAEDEAVLTWLQARPGEQTVILSICAGAQMVADAGLLTGRRATSHHITLPIVEKDHPEVHWTRGLRYVEDGPFISSAGVTSGIDATLYTLQRFLGREAALETARRVGYPHTHYLDDPTWQVPADNSVAVLPNAFRWERTQLGVVLYDGVREIEVGSVIDTYPRSTAADVLTLGAERASIRTAHGLDLVPRFALATAPRLDRVLLPGQADATVTAPVERWAAARGQAVERIHASGGYPYDVTFTDLAWQETRLVAANAARWIEYPIGHLALDGADWRLGLVIRPVVLAALGVGLVLGLQRRQTRRHRALTSQVATA